MKAFIVAGVATLTFALCWLPGCEQKSDPFTFHEERQITALLNYTGWELVAVHGTFSGPYRSIGDIQLLPAPNAGTPGSFTFLQRPGVEKKIALPPGHAERLLGRYENRRGEQLVLEFKRAQGK
jgi:hypothetical protein